MMDKKLITIHWKDSATFREWYDYDEINALVIEDKNIISTGFLVGETEDWVVIASNVDDKSCSAITKIPKCSISKMRDALCVEDVE